MDFRITLVIYSFGFALGMLSGYIQWGVNKKQ